MEVMKKIILFLFFILCYQSIFAQLGYWNEGEFVELVPNESCTYRYVQAMDVESKEILKNLFGSMAKVEKPPIRRIVNDRYLVDKDYILPKINYYESPIYKGGVLTVLPRIVISLKKGYQIDDILEKLGSQVSVERSEVDYRGGKRLYLVCMMRTADEVLKTVKSISGLVKREKVWYINPEMYIKITPYDTYYSQQYYLHKTTPNDCDINVESAWTITTGSPSITVAVVDCGVEINHPDLTGSVLNGYTVDYPNSLGEPVNDVYNTKYHGTSVAGIIAANHNSIGVRGVAGGVKILPVNVVPGEYGYFGTEEEIADAIRWAYPSADIINISWGTDSSYSEIYSAIEEAMYNGRNGKGCVVVAAAGNKGNLYNVSYPARYSGVIAVGAVHKNGMIWDYSQTGSSLSLVAPSGAPGGQGDVVTTDRSAPKGMNPYSDYNFTFGGTSAAAPQVAGVAALMLSVNPNLTRTQIKEKLALTATDLGYYGFDSTYGYGLLNAYQAVLSALPNNISSPHVSTTRSDTPLGYWNEGKFVDLIPDETYSHRFVLPMDAESQKVLNDNYESGDPSLLRIMEDRFFVAKDYQLPEGNYFESPVYTNSTGGIHICVFPTIIVSLKGDSPIDLVLERLGSRVAVERSALELNGGMKYYLTCFTKTSEEVLESIRIIKDLFEDEDINFIEPDKLILDLRLFEMLSDINSLEHKDSKESSRHALDGRRLKSPQKGINIIRQNNGKTRKVVVK